LLYGVHYDNINNLGGDEMDELTILKEELTEALTLAHLSAELSIISARLIDVMLLDKETREKHMDKINELLEEKKQLQMIIVDYKKKTIK
jgi:hypothetical protein